MLSGLTVYIVIGFGLVAFLGLRTPKPKVYRANRRADHSHDYSL